MEYDDRFNATLNNDIDNNMNTLHDVKSNIDKRYHVLNKRVRYGNDFYKNVKIEMYGSGDIGCTIRNAETGEFFSGHQVGSSDEDIYFKTSFFRSPNQESLLLFYHSPEHYERHQFVKVSDDIKRKWYSKKAHHKSFNK